MKKGGVMWVARDKDGTLYLYNEKPYKRGHCWHCDDLDYFAIEELLPEVNWEDEEPTEVELIIKKK